MIRIKLNQLLKIFIGILIFLDVALFISYMVINPQISFAAQLFGYFSSSAFQVLTVSLILPILLLLTNDIFKINEKLIEEKKEKQLNSIKKTNELWNDIAEITAEFIFSNKFEPDQIMDLKIRKEKFIIKAEDELNTWYFEFRNLEEILGKNSHYTDIILIPMSIIESSLSSISYDLQNGDNERIKIVQKQMRIIYNGIKAATHHSTINLMKYSMLLESSNDKEYNGKIIAEYNKLKDFNFILIKELYTNYKFDDQNDDLKDLNDFLEENKYKTSDPKIFKEKFEELYYKLPNKTKINLNDIHEFSPDLIEKLAYIIKIKDLNSNFNIYKRDYEILTSK